MWLTQKHKPVKGKFYTQEKIVLGDKEACEDALSRVGTFSNVLREIRNELRRTFYEMYGDEILGETVVDTIARLNRDMERGRVWVEGRELCTDTGCTDLRHLYLVLDDYHRAIAERSKAIRHVMDTCRGVTPDKCKLEVAGLIGSISRLEELGINAKRAGALIKRMALADDPTLPEAVQRYIDMKVARGRLISCARREYSV